MQDVPSTGLPQHIAVIMDGKCRWASQRGLPKAIGHARGAKRVHSLVETCAKRGVGYWTLFAFSAKNWKRPIDKVTSLMILFWLYLQKEASNMHKNGVCLKIIDDRSALDERLQTLMPNVEAMTAHNSKIVLTIAANYGGRWEMLQAMQAMQAMQASNPGATTSALTEVALRPHLSLAGAPDPDLLIRTGGELRISNFMLWKSAYTELYFTPTLWPDFSADSLDQALAWYAQRERRFGGAEVNSKPQTFTHQLAIG